jgi:tRNA-dependent cyclodipeptide synthase
MKVQFKKELAIANAHVVLPISVGQLYHEGEKFAATLQGVQNKFGSCDIIVADTLQRYNLLTEYSAQDANTLALQRGQEWLQRNEISLKEFSIPHKIIRWDTCLKDPEFANWLEKIKEYYQHDKAYRNTIEEDINTFMQRSINHESIPMRRNSLNYFLEETAVILSYFIRQKYTYIIYPRPMPKSITMAIEHFTLQQYPDLLTSIDFRFR